MRLSLISLILFSSVYVLAQQTPKTFEIEISTDSILMGNTFEFRYTVRNMQGRIDVPEFGGMEVFGPQQQSSMQIVNGVSSSMLSRLYVVKPLEPGVLTIPPAYFVAKDTTLESRPVDIICLPNPEGIEQHSRLEESSMDLWGQPAPGRARKKKLKETRI